VGIDDIINKAKHLFRGKADDASDAQAGTAVGADGTVSGKLAEAEDETPDAVDPVVDKIADKAKDIF
jgi:hypothetical protein